MAIAPLGQTKLAASTAQSSKDIEKEFVGKAGRVLPSPRRNRVKSGDDNAAYALNFLLYGPYGSGKTLSALGPLKAGMKVLFVVTDLGDNGVSSIKLALKNEGLTHLASNYKVVSLNDYDEVVAFLTEPAEFFPDIYEWNPDFIFWDGFSYFQQTDLMQKAGEDIKESNDINLDKGSREKEVSTLRAEGTKFELADYAVVRNLTVRVIKAFCRLHNKKTGKLWHKIITCQEALKSKGADAGGGFIDSASPLLTGAGGVLMCGAFDLIIRTKDAGKDGYTYTISKDASAVTKNRGFNLPKTMPGDFSAVWNQVCKDLDLVNGAVDESVKAPVLLEGE